MMRGKNGKGKGKATKAIHLRKNGWGLGMYDWFDRDGEIVVGQLCHIDMDTGMGTFRGYVLNDKLGQGRDGQYREWSHTLMVSEPSKVHDVWVRRYENFLRSIEENS